MIAGEVAAARASWLAEGRPSERYQLRDFWYQAAITGSDAHGLTEIENNEYLDWVEGETRALIEEWWESIEAVSAALLEKKTLTQAQVCTLVH